MTYTSHADRSFRSELPKDEYIQRAAARRADLLKRTQQHTALGYLKIVVIVAVCTVFWRTGFHQPYLIGLLCIVFIALIVLHHRVSMSMESLGRAIKMYERGIARIEDRWMGAGDAGMDLAPLDHIYADDLDIFGDDSLFQLLCSARTRMGKRTLAKWLLAPAAATEIPERQGAVRELSRKIDLREQLAVIGTTDAVAADPEKLISWAHQYSGLNYQRFWPWVVLLVLASITVVIGSAFSPIFRPFLLLLLFNGAINVYLLRRLLALFSGLRDISRNLDSVAGIVRTLEIENFESSYLINLQNQLRRGTENASSCIARLSRLCDLEESQRNIFMQVLNIPTMYSIQLAFALERWRRKHAEAMQTWLNVVGEAEALVSIGAFAFEHPEDIFPNVIVEGAPRFDAIALGHPLISKDKCVRNNVDLGGRSQVLLVSGSNMSGKSTLLRAIGCNTVLAMMGAPTRAEQMSLTPTALSASIRISDSLRKGVSHFYAEITRVRDIVNASRSGPVLFLLDEVFQGTNSRDRFIGAEGIIRTLLRHGAIGLVTTHDLALAAIVDDFADRIKNVHLQETLKSGNLTFDYHLRDGIVTSSNGVELMRSIGLEV